MQSRLPAVAFGGGYGWYVKESPIPYFYANNQAVARLAADHLLERGFKHFAFCGYARTAINGWSHEREEAFVAHVEGQGGRCAVFRDRQRPARQWAALQRAMGEWLRKLPKPLGVMAANDTRGRQVLEACRAHDLNVPNEVAVIGVDNDELLCQLSSPPMSSVETGARQLGYAAAAQLDTIMQGRKPRRKHFVIDPMSVVTRQSTDVLAIDDQKVAQAMAFIREHACEGINVPRVVGAVGHLEVRTGNPLYEGARLYDSSRHTPDPARTRTAPRVRNGYAAQAGRVRYRVQIGAAHDHAVREGLWRHTGQAPPGVRTLSAGYANERCNKDQSDSCACAP